MLQTMPSVSDHEGESYTADLRMRGSLPRKHNRKYACHGECGAQTARGSDTRDWPKASPLVLAGLALEHRSESDGFARDQRDGLNWDHLGAG